MRFAYIDSNGNEVPIPSVDALALRIELGAITEETQLYDAQADQWGEAHTHEIYHTLARSSGAGDGFIAPPPVAPPPVAAPGAAESESDTELDMADLAPTPAEPVVDEGAAMATGPEAAADLGLTLAEAPAPAEEEDAASFGLTLAEPSPAEDGTDDATLDFGGLGLAPPLEPEAEVADMAPLDLDAQGGDVGAGPDDDALGPSFDFGGMEGSLELEGTFETPDPEPMSFDVAGGVGDMDAGGDAGLGLETAMEFDSGGFQMDSGDAMELEKPMSEFTPGAPPTWMDPEEADAQEDVLDLSSVSGEPDAADGADARERRAPRTRPSPPKLRRQRSFAGPLIGIFVLVAFGVGGYTAWPLLSERLAGSGQPDEPAVFLPPISDAQMAQMRDAADGAFARTFADARARWASGGAVDAPPRDWLAGVYLANASDYAEVSTFWGAMGDWLDDVRSIGLAEFDEALAAQMAGSGVDGADAIRERADSGFVAAVAERDAVYARMEALVDAAIRLHQFLEANQANIEHVPATSVTTDPVMEVRPASEQIGAALGDLLDAVTGSLGALGYRDQVTAQGLQARLLQMVQETGVR
jgi:hypothetical protein